ncbi:MAG: hypothetical protein CNE99_01350 [OM182 bacterium MED-G24]|uniref:Phytanoyl-CoA dioxygenase n=1 Tax=OM182 bacterium MED-G24 TaxID=1986255 RepID=A0A2A5WZD8_9GAMM|nr:MAG: hypothetical protein CNE99_01350 [OM182 bacterium MED-G24]|tara:strand:+ start:3720 stop:4811 length:1092 start_codon:yes stop_codon:yes gene_type:complete
MTTGESFEEYCEDGRKRALSLGNRGPAKFDAQGRLAQDILDAYNANGFYVFTGVVDTAEIAELIGEFEGVLENAPVNIGEEIDRQGEPVRYPYYTLSGDDEAKARGEPSIVGLISHPLMLMDSALRLYGHPDLLRIAASIHGDDFVPFHESIFHKGAGEGPPTNWHQDGRTHWDETGRALEQPDGTGKRHGYNLSVAFCRCTPANALWVVPGSHRQWCLANGGEFPPIRKRIPEAVPVLLEPGDCGMVNRSSLHGAYANLSRDRRVTLLVGFHNRDSAIGTETVNVHAFPIPNKKKHIRYDEEYVLRRAQMIPLAIDARRQHFPDEVPYEYQGTWLGGADWNENARAEITRSGDEYWQRDITL